MMSIHPTVFRLAGLLALVASVEARSWTDVQGRTIEAELVSHDEKEVILRLPNGKNAFVPLSNLSEKDIAFLNGEIEEDSPPAPAAEKEEEKEKPGDGLNWDDPWPDTVEYKEDPQINIVEEDDEKKKWVYESANYRFICDVRLSKSVVGNLAEMFESTYQFSRALPLAITGGVQTDGKFAILLFEEFDSYVKAGGPPSSAGVFMGGKNVVMVPLTSLGVRKVGSGYMRDRDKSDKVLVHELVHQLTPRVYYHDGSAGWFTEGLAEYCAMTPYSNGRFKVRSSLDSVEESVTGYDRKTNRGRALGTDISAPDLKSFMTMDYGEFTGSKANFNYGMGALLTTYFIHLDGEGDAKRLKEFVKKLREIGDSGNVEDAFAELLDGRTWDEMEEAISKAWGRKGVDIEFD